MSEEIGKNLGSTPSLRNLILEHIHITSNFKDKVSLDLLAELIEKDLMQLLVFVKVDLKEQIRKAIVDSNDNRWEIRKSIKGLMIAGAELKYTGKVPLPSSYKTFGGNPQIKSPESPDAVKKFFNLYVDTGEESADCKIPTHELYRYFCNFAGITLDENDKPLNYTEWSLTHFTKAILADYANISVKQIKIKGYPIQFYIGVRLKNV